jgi:hypothetical protein
MDGFPFTATKARVSTRGNPPDAFLHELLTWGRMAPAEIFARNAVPDDIYTRIAPFLGPWDATRPQMRRAAMLEAMRVLAGFESSWNWNCGSDTTRRAANTPRNMEAGAWQVSADSIPFGADLHDLVMRAVGNLDGTNFQRAMKADHAFAMEYVARLLRHTVRHNGPVLIGTINQWLSRAALKEWEALLA